MAKSDSDKKHNPDEVLKRMLRTPPKKHTSEKKKEKQTKNPAK